MKNSEVSLSSTSTHLGNGLPYEYAVLHGDVQDQQAQIDDLRTQFETFRTRYVTSSTITKVADSELADLSPLWALKSRPRYRLSDFDRHSSRVGASAWRALLIAHQQERALSEVVEKIRSKEATLLLGAGEPLPKDAVDSRSATASIPLHVFLKLVGAGMACVSMGSLAFWLLGEPFILNPFVSLLTLLAAPFAVAMGFAAKRG
jgi:hypothetical protein